MSPTDPGCALRSGDRHDVIVVGAEPAGVATALLLARRSLRVALLDRHAAPSTTDATAPLLRAGVLLLSRWGVLGPIAAATPPITRTTLHYGDEHLGMSVKPSPGVDAFYAPSMRRLAATLEAAALDAGVEFHRGTAVTDVIVGPHRVLGVEAVTADHRTVALRAPLVVGADGIHSTIAERVGAPLTWRARHATAATYAYWPMTGDGYEWLFGAGVNAGIVPTDRGRACVFVNAAGERVGGGGPARIAELVAALASGGVTAVRPATVRRPGHTSVAGWGQVRRAHGPGWALVGEAGYSKEPLGPHGYTDALRDAELLARAVADGLGGPDDAALVTALEHYEHRRDRLGLPLFHVLDRLAGEQHDDGETAQWLVQLGSAMADEVEALAALEPDVVPDPERGADRDGGPLSAR